MNNKSNFKYILILIYLLLSYNADSALPNTGLYVSVQYQHSMPAFSDFSAKETHVDTKQLFALTKKYDSKSITIDSYNVQGMSSELGFTESYIPEFQNNIISFYGTIGYFVSERLRVEIESFHKHFDVKNNGYTIRDAHRFFALARQTNDSQDKIKMVESPKRDRRFYNEIAEAGNHHVIMQNNGLYILSAMVNICRDFSYKLSVLPYICAGIGVDIMDFFDVSHVKFSYQGKVGISYYLFPKVNLFADLHLHKVLGNQFKNLRVIDTYRLKEQPQSTSGVATLNVAYFGSEFGIRFTL